jgi:hypothetical protein
MGAQDLSTDMTRIRLGIREIQALLKERAKGISDNAKNIGEAFPGIRAVAADLGKYDEDPRRIGQRGRLYEDKAEEGPAPLSGQIERLRDTPDARPKGLDANFHPMSEVRSRPKTPRGFPIAMATAWLLNFFVKAWQGGTSRTYLARPR